MRSPRAEDAAARNSSSTLKRSADKSFFDELVAGVGASDPDQWEEKPVALGALGVNFKFKDQYLGTNLVTLNKTWCGLITWATPLGKPGHNAQLMYLCADEGKVITQGRALEGNCGAHNWALSRIPKAYTVLC